jgi:hypothetical protein
VFRARISSQDICQLVSIDEAILDSSLYTIAVRTSLMSGVNPIDLEINKHSWTMCFNLFQTEAVLQLEANGFQTFFFSFTLAPREGGQESDLFLCMRICKIDAGGKSGIYAPADIDPDVIQDRIHVMGFPFK